MNLFKKPTTGAEGGAVALVAAGDRARDARDWPAAATHYRRALDASPALPAIWVQYGHALKESGRLSAARDAYRRAAEIAPDIADTHLQMGHAAKLAGELDEAASCYVQALTLQPNYDDALRELQALSARGVRIDVSRLREQWSDSGPEAPPARPDPVARLAQAQSLLAEMRDQMPEHAVESRHAREQLSNAVEILRRVDANTLAPLNGAGTGSQAEIVFDATDLIHHFRSSRLPTGIQRVQLEMISAYHATGRAQPRICYLGDAGWLEVPRLLFARLCRMFFSHADNAQAEWQQVMMQLDLLMHGGGPMTFPRGAWLISLGTSWFPNYLLHVRQAKRAYGIRYVPFVHDLIPVVMPEHCVDDLVDRFVTWLLGVFSHADRFLVNSESTRRDLAAAATRLGHPLSYNDIEVVRLDADIRKSDLPPAEAAGMQGWGWNRQPFVLMLSTVEPRKNHLAALRAWRTLVDHHGARHVPQLVCVGGKGWKNEAVFSALENDPMLASRVTMLSGLTDAQLSLLFQRCMFTLYPSLYEGWGLPVTESLCYGKVPVVSDISSLPEAGGLFAHYFDPTTPADLLQALERLIFDAGYRETREASIRAEFRPRKWQQLGEQVAQAVEMWDTQIRHSAAERQDDIAPCAPRLLLGRYYPISAQHSVAIRHGMIASESLRAGDGWCDLEPWGCWSKPGESRIAFHLPEDMRGERVRIFLGVRGMPALATRYRLEMAEGICAEGELDIDQMRWIATDATMPADANAPVEIFLYSSQYESLADSSDGADQRVIGAAVVGIYVCAANDVVGRLRLVEAVTLGSLDTLTGTMEGDSFAAAARQTAQLLAGL